MATLLAVAVWRGGAVGLGDSLGLIAGVALICLLDRRRDGADDCGRAESWAARGPLLLLGWTALALAPLPFELVAAVSPERAALERELVWQTGMGGGWIVWSVRPAATLFELARLAAAFALFDLVRRRAPAAPAWWIAPLVALAAVEAAFGLAQHLGRHASLAAPGHYVNRNHFAGLLAMAASPALAAAVCGVRRSPWLLAGAGAALAVIVAGLLASYSRGGHLAALAGLATTAALLAGGGRARPGRLAAAGLLALVLGWWVAPRELVDRYRGLADASSTAAAVDRWELWRESFELANDYPLTGTGLGGYESAFPRRKVSGAGFRDDHAHNDYLEWAVETGWPGLALAAAVVLPLGLRAVRSTAAAPPGAAWAAAGAVGGAVAFLAHEAVDFNGRIPANALVFAWIGGLALSFAKPGRRFGR